MNTNATAPRQNAFSLRQRHQVTVVTRRILIRPSATLSNPQAADEASIRSLPSLPIYLPLSSYQCIRPREHEVDIEAFDRMWPVFNGAPPLFVRENLPMKGKQMLHNVRNTKILDYPHSNPGEPQERDVLFKGPVYNENEVPSHILALNSFGCGVKLIPVHQIILAANCAELPYFPYSSSTTGNTTGRFTLPVVKLDVPSLSTFHILHEYLYTKDVVFLRRALTPPFNFPQSIANLRNQLAIIRGVWMNACVLCVVESEIYSVMKNLYTEAHNILSLRG